MPASGAPELKAEAGFCLLMYDSEPMKPSNTGRLNRRCVAGYHLGVSLVAHRAASRVADPAGRSPPGSPMWSFPLARKEPARLTGEVTLALGKKPLFILLDGTWAGGAQDV